MIEAFPVGKVCTEVGVRVGMVTVSLHFPLIFLLIGPHSRFVTNKVTRLAHVIIDLTLVFNPHSHHHF